MKQYIDAYLLDHETAWATSTMKSERARLKSVADTLSQGPAAVYGYLKGLGQKPYTIKTAFIRICALERWAKLEPKYQDWMRKHANKFKHAYQKRELEISYEEALSKIRSLIGPTPAGTHALGLIHTGCRVDESYRVESGEVVGKGGKPRKIFGTIEAVVPKVTLWRKLKEIGIKPHDLRKLCATRLAENGGTAADLMKVFGWSDIRTASVYLQGKDEERLKALMETLEKE